MKVGLCQFAPAFGEKERNFEKIAATTRQTRAELLVFPELCTTGYQFVSQEETDRLCEIVPDGPTVEALSSLCRETGRTLVAGLGESDKGVCYNTSVLIGPDGYIGKYRKVHLFFEEKNWFRPGDTGFPVWDIGAAKIGMMICFDWVFPEAVRSLALRGADIICHPVNLVLPYCQQAMITRSIENGVFIVTANRIGSEARGGKKRLTFTGSSQITGPRGKLLFRLGEDTESVRIADIDPLKARDKNLTPHNHILTDRRPGQYHL